MIHSPRPLAHICVDELFLPVNVTAASALFFMDGTLLSPVSGSFASHVPLDSLVCGAHNLELIPVDRDGSVCD